MIQYIKKPSEEVQLAAVNEDGYAIQYIENPSESVQLAAASKVGWAIEHIKNPNEAVQLAAVSKHGRAIQYIKKPSEAVQLAAFVHGGGFFAARFWLGTFRPSAHILVRTIQESGRAFALERPTNSSDKDPYNLHEKFNKGLNVVRACLIGQPANDILELAAVAPALFEPPELLDILRKALLEQAAPVQGITPSRSI